SSLDSLQLPRADAPRARATSRLGDARSLFREGGDDLVAPVAIEIRQGNVRPLTASGEARHGVDLAREAAVPVAAEHESIAVAGERHDVRVAVAIDVADGQRGHA